MPAIRNTLLCRYHYDPLDRLAACTPSAQASAQRFYQKERLTCEIQGSAQRSIFQQDDQLLAQQQHQNEASETTLLGTDQQRSVLHALDATQPHPVAYTPYGHRPAQNGLLSLLGFNGERPDPVTGHYLLGNGYRAFNPVLMRFNSPDSLSPFGEGGLNAYAYCVGDPVNQVDPTGHVNLVKGLKNFFNLRTPRVNRADLAYDAALAETSNVGTPSVSAIVPGPDSPTAHSPAAAVNSLPPGYSPPPTRTATATATATAIGPRDPAAVIRRLEVSASIHRRALDDIHNHRVMTSSETYARRVQLLQNTEHRISALLERLPPPSYESTLINTPSNGLPSYSEAIRNGLGPN